MAKSLSEAAELLKKMVSYNTVNANLSGIAEPEKALVDFLCTYAKDLQFDTRLLSVPDQSDELLILYEKDPALPWLLFDSHIDTVTVDNMTVDPFAGEIREGRLWGRGASDTKGTGAAMFTALKRYAGSGTEGGGNVALLFSVDEEFGMTGICEFTKVHCRRLGLHFTGAIVGEPTSLKPVVAHNGVLRFVVRTDGVAVHSSNPALGKSAISSMSRLIVFLENEYIPFLSASHNLTGKAQFSINVIKGGVAVNIIPDGCEIQIDRRLVPGESGADAIEDLQRALVRFRQRFPDDNFDLQVYLETPALTPSEDAGFQEHVLSVLSKAGMRSEAEGATYATHAGELSAAGFPVVVLGPGDIAQGHTKDEWIDLLELEKGVEAYLALMKGF